MAISDSPKEDLSCFGRKRRTANRLLGGSMAADRGWSHATKDGLFQMVNIRFRQSTATCGNNAESELRWSAAVAAYGVISEFGCRAPLTDGPKSSSSVSHFTFLGASSSKAFNRRKGKRSLSPSLATLQLIRLARSN